MSETRGQVFPVYVKFCDVSIHTQYTQMLGPDEKSKNVKNMNKEKLLFLTKEVVAYLPGRNAEMQHFAYQY